MKSTPACWLLFFALLLASASARADVKPANIFGSHMVLQRDLPIKIWGWAGKSESVSIEFHGQKKRATPDQDGKWTVVLESEPAGGPFSLVISGRNTIVFEDVLVGDVWVCSGQSNMEWILKNAVNGDREVAAANFPAIRHLEIPDKTSLQPEKDIAKSTWQVCNPAQAGQFSAVAYFFARKLYEETKIPIGLVNSTWGGTHCETWMSKTTLQNCLEFQEAVASLPQSLPDFEQMERRKLDLLIDKFQGNINRAATADGWESEYWNDADWMPLQAPQLWEEQGLQDFDGVVWLRKSITLTEAQALQPATLLLGTIDDCDSTYLNGQKIGFTCSWDLPRIYPVPAGLLKPGRNVIAVKVIDWGGGGGFYGQERALQLVLGKDSIALAGAWKASADRQSIQTSLGPNTLPTLLFNGMVSPIIPFGIKGVIWYQGESNVPRAAQYARAFPLLITDWRTQWQQGDFPFYFVQLAAYLLPEKNNLMGSDWAELRDAQRQALALPNTGMVVATDIGDANDIHPRNKQDVGLRLALQALRHDYGKNIEYSGPLYRSMQVNGREIELSFDHAGSGLVAKNKYGYLFGFAIAGADQQFKWAKATIKGDKVVVFSEEVPNPVAVRFGWLDNPEETNLFNREGLPASPFRTDNWKLITEGVRFGH
jgi:sialate O-acetylesterase